MLILFTFINWGLSIYGVSKTLFFRVTEIRSEILTPLETTGGISFSLESRGLNNRFLQFGGIQISCQGVYNSVGGIQICFQGIYNSIGGIQISCQGVYNSIGGIQISCQGFYNSSEGFRYPARGFIIP